MPDTRNDKRNGASKRELAGRCQCGTVKYAVADAFAYAAFCHCADCRRMTGSAFKPFAGIAADRFRIIEGEDHLMKIGHGSYDARCDTCGSYLFSLVRDGQFVHVTMGSLIDSPSIRPSSHIFVGSKAPWLEINDDLPQYERHASGPPGDGG